MTVRLVIPSRMPVAGVARTPPATDDGLGARVVGVKQAEREVEPVIVLRPWVDRARRDALAVADMK
jgi:hypothetical protein